MLIQIFTSSKRIDENSFMIKRVLYTDYLSLESLKETQETDSQLLADIYNIGFAMRSIIEDDRKFGIVHKELKYKHQQFSGTDSGKSIKNYSSWIEYETGIKRFATVYTENEEVFNNIRYSLRTTDKHTIKCLNKIIQLKQEFSIGVSLLKESEITNDLIEIWKDNYKD
jgi:hypothetical protein